MPFPLTGRQHGKPVFPLVLVIGTAIGALAANLYGLIIGITIVIPHLLYIPIILASFYYPRRGVPFAVCISITYILMVVSTRTGIQVDLVSAFARCVVFVVIAAVVSYLSLRISEEETQIRHAKEEWERTFDAVPDLITLIDLSYRILRINRAMAEKLCIKPDEAVGLHCYEVVHCTNTPPDICPHSRLILDGLEHTSEVHEDHLGGDFVVTVSPLRDQQGNLTGSVHVARDISERKRVEEALRQANKKLNILSSVTRHDIVNKITALLAYLEISQELIKDPAVLEYIQKEIDIIKAIERQIDFTRYYQDIGVRLPEWQEVASTIRRAADQLPMSGISLKLDFEDVSVYADPLIEKVFYNLMENAIRHGEHVTAIRYKTEESADGLNIIYEDNGIGILPENKEKIFLRGFGRHTGLGLFLIREILSITGISISESGESGKGARFEIRVPKGGYRLSDKK